MIPLMEWNEIIEYAKEKRLQDKGIEPKEGKRRYAMIVLSRM